MGILDPSPAAAAKPADISALFEPKPSTPVSKRPPGPGVERAEPAATPPVCRVTDLIQTLTSIRDNAGDLPVTIVMGQLKGALVDVRSITHVQLGTPKGHPEQIVLLFAAKAREA